jgi:hypothetical protein
MGNEKTAVSHVKWASATERITNATCMNAVRARKLVRNVSALSEALFHKSVKSSEVLCARSIEPFEGGRWRLRRMRASGCTDITAMGIESFFVCSLLILLGLGK